MECLKSNRIFIKLFKLVYRCKVASGRVSRSRKSNKLQLSLNVSPNTISGKTINEVILLRQTALIPRVIRSVDMANIYRESRDFSKWVEIIRK